MESSEKDCTLKCRSSDHAKKILTCAVRATPSQIRAYSVWICHNFSTVTDNLGRNLLHLAASCGKEEVVQWLLEKCKADVDVKDLESGWTALHRSFFYGHLASARILANHGANIRSTDHEGFTPLDLILKDRLPYIEHLPTNPLEVYAWGANFNYSLGSGNIQSSATPEILEIFRKANINIKQVVVCKFHSVFLSVDGKVFTCGYGHGGRLGQGTEESCLVPSLVKNLDSSPCIQVASGQDHLLLLFEDGQIMSCGLNTYHQLGHSPPSERLLKPRPISLKFLKEKSAVGVRAACFHSVIFTKDSIFTFGLNAGQLGFPKGDRTHILPKQVSALNIQHLSHVEASDGATVCATRSGEVYVLHEYQCRKIATRQLEIAKLSVVGGNLDSRCGVEVVKESGGLELRVILLTKSGKVFLWRETDPHLRRCLFSSPKQLIISDIHINHNSLAMITSDNEGYTGHILPFKGQKITSSASPRSCLSQSYSGFNCLLDKENCHFIRVKRLPHIHRGVSVTSDGKGRNYAVLQSSPKMGFVELPLVSDSDMQRNLSRFLAESNSQDGICDIVVKVGSKEFAAHKYILASHSGYFKKRFDLGKIEKKNDIISIDAKMNIAPEAFEEILKFIYSNSCNLLTPDFEVKEDIKKQSGKQKKKLAEEKSNSPLKSLKSASKNLNIHSLSRRLENVRMENRIIKVIDSNYFLSFSFDRHALLHLSDVNLRSESGKIFPCHKCILVARLDYFRSMLSCCWIENSQLNELSLPISSDVLEVILDYLYTDQANKILNSGDTDFLCSVLMVTDQFLMSRLKEMCEMALVELITLKNAPDMLELASVSNSVQLKRSCMEYICINLSAFFEAKGLDNLSDDIIKELSVTYRQMIPSMRKRIATTNMQEPSFEDLTFIENTFPISNERDIEKFKSDIFGIKAPENKSKIKKKSHSGSMDYKGFSPNSRAKTISESSEKDIVLDVMPKIEDLVLDDNFTSPDKDYNNKTPEPCAKLLEKRPPQWIMNFPKIEAPGLGEIMHEEKQNMTVLSPVNEIKHIPHMAKKQKKHRATNKSPEDLTDISVPKTPPCPWAKTILPSPPPPSFWKTLNKRNYELPNEKSELALSPTSTKLPEKITETPLDSDSVSISLDVIQRAEEKKLLRAKPKIKSLHIINIEDQAIEELLSLYKAVGNPEEMINVTRVLSEVASPVWKKQMCNFIF